MRRPPRAMILERIGFRGERGGEKSSVPRYAVLVPLQPGAEVLEVGVEAARFVHRAEAAGYAGIVVTLDTWTSKGLFKPLFGTRATLATPQWGTNAACWVDKKGGQFSS